MTAQEISTGAGFLLNGRDPRQQSDDMVNGNQTLAKKAYRRYGNRQVDAILDSNRTMP